ncbi:PolC-type DNA polymerase III [Caldicellulosiruptor changbaiensis]|uniref:DNA polymerase III PolC-type n=1 Tax=Caldicellulosiruptor changbaiensis TaxID=1222016 RepID=A0A3T0D6T8_9FIRM|nr:PolC-type DNA polymerase III [Caldicellulosiruptor changbaiensis]AZT90807.1 PolC-type DNA polymerase III [Caldicellulosiruptor changbaiensis]
MSEVAYLPLKPVKVEFDKANKCLKIYIDDIEGLDEINLIELESRFKNSLDICEDVEVKLLNNKVANIKELLQKHKWFLVYKISKKCNGLKAFLKECEITLEDDKLVFLVPNGIRDIMLERRLDVLVKNILSEEFGCKCDVEFRIKDFYIHFDFDSEIESYLKESEEKRKEKEAKEADKKDIQQDPDVIFGKRINEKEEITPISLIKVGSKCIIEGEVFNIEIKETKNQNILVYKLYVTDYNTSTYVKIVAKKDNIPTSISVGDYIKVEGNVEFDEFEKAIVVNAKNVNRAVKPERLDTAEVKRVELHAHTKMSTMDAVCSAEELIKTAAKWGHRAIAITDHGVVQAFPEAQEVSKSEGVKVIYGMECYLIDDGVPVVYNPKENQSLDTTFVVVDIETTGFDNQKDRIIEIGAVKIENGEIVDRFSTFVDPEGKIPIRISELTGIYQNMVDSAPKLSDAILEFEKFCSGAILVAHNAQFDIGFLKRSYQECGLIFDYTYIDTLELSRRVLTDLSSHKLNKVAEFLNIELKHHHRADSDAETTAKIFISLIEKLKSRGYKYLKELNAIETNTKADLKSHSYHATILVKNQQGLKNLYKLVSYSHLEYFYKRPRIPKSVLIQLKDGLILGSACESGEIFRAIMEGKSDEELEKIASLYDFLEIMPVENNSFLIREGYLKDEEQLRQINKKIYQLGKKVNKLVVATSDAHYCHPHQRILRQILKHNQGYNDVENDPYLYFRTTDEMLKEFEYLGKEAAYEVVVENTNKIADMIEDVKPIPDETFPPKIEGAEEEIYNMTMKRAHEIYGEPLPEIVKQRLEKELNSIIKNGFAVMYLIAQKLVSKSLSDGYLVGSRGSVGSSLVATMCGITEVNPLPPHYVCPNCKYSEFVTDGTVGCGYDLEDKDCPRCGTKLRKDGHDIPFETFLGFDGDKEPDIDLNFSGEYQPIAHKFTEDLFGQGYVFRAGTISTVAEKTAHGFVTKYAEEKGLSLHPAEVLRLSQGCTGVKRTTGQHPGGLMIVPKDKEIFDFTPIQHPADSEDKSVITTHFDYHAISGRLLKLDILGHDDPTVIRMLQDLTGVDPRSIPLDDKATLSIFTSTEALGISPEDIDCEVGTFGIPEFGTRFVRQMLIETKPKSFAELVRISGLSHGTNVWTNNAQDLVRNGIATLKEVISTRDDIMLYLIQKGVPPKDSFRIMEDVRKGKGLKPEDEELLRSYGVPEWYIESCKKITYMFPKAHAAAYVMMAFRIAYFKVHYKEAFYATYFTVRADDFDYATILKGREFIRQKIRDMENRMNTLSQKDKNLLTVLEIANEMLARGLKFYPVDLNESDAEKFIIKDGGLLIPFNALPNVGIAAARNIVEARKEGKFLSIDDLQRRAKLNKQVIEILTQYKVLKDLPQTSQLSFF